MAGRSAHLGSLLALSLLALAAGPAAAGEGTAGGVKLQGSRSISVQEQDQKTAPARKVGSEDAVQQKRKTDPRPTAAPPDSGLDAARKISPGLRATTECGSGFVKQAADPAGIYACRLPAGPACSKGYDYIDDFALTHPARFQYKCKEWVDADPAKCQQGWTKAGPSSHYSCTSSLLACKLDHRLDGVSRTGPTPTSGNEGGTGTAVYTYRCRPR